MSARARRPGPTGILLACLLAGSAATAAAQGLEGLLLPSAAESGYRGRKVVVDFTPHGPQVTSMSVLCQPGGRERREFQAPHGLLVVDGRHAWQYFPQRGVVVKRPARSEGGEVLRPEQLRRALVSYEVISTPAAPVAGRSSRTLEFTPRQSGSRPRRRIWIDADTGLILRAEVYGPTGRLSWLSVFEDLEYHPALDVTAFTMPVPSGVRLMEVGAEPCLEPAQAARLAGLPVALPGYVPEGFERQCIRARRQRDYGEIQVVFGDGLSLLSLFASTSYREPGAGSPAGTAVAVGPWTGLLYDLGPVSGIAWQTPGAHLALLGELSQAELRKIAGSVR